MRFCSLLTLASLLGCKAPSATAPPADAAAGAADQAAMDDAGDQGSIDELERALTRNEADLRGQGVRIPGESEREERVTNIERDAAGTREPAATDARTRCERICDLAAVTCDLRERICSLASEHADDPRYEGACERAGIHCDVASDACRSCSG